MVGPWVQIARTCAHRPKTLQIRNVPDDVHRILEVRAAQEGRSLSELALEELRRVAALPSREEWLARLAEREPVELTESAADAVRALREDRG